MRILQDIGRSRKTLHAKLFIYMLILTALLLLAIFAGLFSVGTLDNTQKEIHDTLDLQMEFLCQDIEDYFLTLAVTGVQLSEDVTELIEDYLENQHITLNDLNNSEADINAVQEALFEPLKQKLLQTDCSGAFIMLDATVNSKIEGAQHSKSGLYLQISGFEFPDTSILLFRGNSQISKHHGVMPHRKWRLEFDAALFPNYDEVISGAKLPLESSYKITDLFILPGTSEEALLVAVPLIGENGMVYGICGFEISQSYFKIEHAQPTKLSHLACIMAKDEGGKIDLSKGLNCGVSGGYYLEPTGELLYNNSKSGLLTFEGDQLSYVGVIKKVKLCQQSDDFLLAIMIPRSDYASEVTGNIVQIAIFIALLLFFGIICCLYFTHKFLSPILSGLKSMKGGNFNDIEKTNVPEIDDLFDFLAKKDREHEAELRQLEDKNRDVENEYAKAQTKIAQLADKKSDQIDMDIYKMFLKNLHTLTPREREIFDYYLQGKNAKEIHAHIGVSENTVKFHNKNIYSKLGVSSRKQLLQYAKLMSKQEDETLKD